MMTEREGEQPSGFYRYQPNANDFSGLGFSMSDNERIVQIHFTDTPLAVSWIAPVAHGFEDNPETEGDFPSLSNFNEIPIMSQRAWEVLRPLIGYCCEALPISHPAGKSFFIIHVMDTVDGLDIAKSDLTRNATTDRVNCIRRYAFKAGMLNEKHILKLPLESGGEWIVDDAFRNIVDANKLQGLRFKALPV